MSFILLIGAQFFFAVPVLLNRTKSNKVFLYFCVYSYNRSNKWKYSQFSIYQLTAQKAEISKGTFYLHYLDIFNTYPDLFTDPESFIRIFMFEQIEPFGKILTIGERALLSEKNIRYCSNYLQCFIDAIRMQIYNVGKLVSCEENDIKIEFLLTGILSIVIKYRPSANKNIQQTDFIVQFLTAIIKETFPEFYGTHVK
ncbi:MAG: hypothetical protein Q4F21_11065 [Lachnospiraceae bacterium]|nr:hypothetical protein [Lachnospiraceae bacterium]